VSVARVLAFPAFPNRIFFPFVSFRTLLSIRDFTLSAAQAKWISRFVAKASMQDALMQYDQQLRDAAMSFQVRCRPASMLPFQIWN